MVSPVDKDTAAEPRRSGRLAARAVSVQPTAPVEMKVKAPRGGKRKKTAEKAKEEEESAEEEEGVEESTSKKVSCSTL